MSSLPDMFFKNVDGAFAVDAGQRITFWDAGCSQLLGIPVKSALGRRCSDVIRGKDTNGDPFCSGGCCVAGLTRGGGDPRTFPLLVSDVNGDDLALWVSIVLTPSRKRDHWTCVHMLQRGTMDDLLDSLENPMQADVGRHSDVTANDATSLTPRESQILKLLSEGLKSAVISEYLHISPVTVRNHIQHIQKKLGVHSQMEAVAYAYRHPFL